MVLAALCHVIENPRCTASAFPPKLILNCVWVVCVVLSCRITISLVRIFFVVVSAKSNGFAFVLYARKPFFSLCVPTNAFITRLVVCLFFFVFLILFFANRSEIHKSVVHWNSVYMVNVFWQFAINIKPSQTMRKV